MILIIAATPIETKVLRKQLNHSKIVSCNSFNLFSGSLCGQNVLIGHGGIGQVNMTLQLTQILNNYQPQTVFLVGCGGSYPNNELNNGDLVLASKEIFGDLGVITNTKFIPLDHLEMPQDIQLAPLVQQQFTLDPNLLEWAQKVVPQAQSGTFVTVNSCSGHTLLSDELQHRTMGICENMEGAAVAQVCTNFNIPLLELRGISNPTGTRDPHEWDIKTGVTSAQAGILTLLENWASYQ